MAYGFHFKLSSEQFIYYESCKNEEGARTKLEEMARAHCNIYNLGIGEILYIEGGERKILSSYNYLFKGKKLVREELH